MMLFIYISLSFSLISQSARGDLGIFFEREETRDAGDSILTTEADQFVLQGEISNNTQNEYDKELSGYRSDETDLNSTYIYSNETYKREEVFEESNNTQSTSSNNVSSEASSASTSVTLTTSKIQPLTGSFNNNSQQSSPGILVSSTISPVVVSETTKSGSESTLSSNASSTQFNMSSSEPDEEPEGVVIIKPSLPTTNGVSSFTKTIYQKSLELLNDTYAMSILVPVAAGVIFATSIIITIAVCRCCRRKCRRRRFRKKVLPDSVKNLRPSDRARLLAETSDEEF